MKLGIVIQARLGSTRLPSKIIQEIDNNITFLDYLLAKFYTLKDKFPVILASTLNSNDSNLEAFANKHDIRFFRGSEENVTQRYVSVAEKYDLDVIVRVCSDNPFLDVESLGVLIESYSGEDYLSFSVNNIPAILTHFGFFAEIVKTDALKQINNDNLCNEHVTNCIYKSPEKFNVKFLNKNIDNNSIRCTLDTQQDLNNIKEIYTKFIKNHHIQPLGYQEIINYISSDNYLMELMEKEIEKNSK